jgi:hypothetical protein
VLTEVNKIVGHCEEQSDEAIPGSYYEIYSVSVWDTKTLKFIIFVGFFKKLTPHYQYHEEF